jgi:hypothetical protein
VTAETADNAPPLKARDPMGHRDDTASAGGASRYLSVLRARLGATRAGSFGIFG